MKGNIQTDRPSQDKEEEKNNNPNIENLVSFFIRESLKLLYSQPHAGSMRSQCSTVLIRHPGVESWSEYVLSPHSVAVS